MAYSTPAMVRLAAAPDLTDPAQPATDTNTVADNSDISLLQQIVEADSTIDSYLSGRYVTPVAPVDPEADPPVYPTPLPSWSRDIALYLATLTMRKNLALDTATAPVALRYRDIMVQLTAIRDGKSNLPLPVNDGGSGASGGAGDPLNAYDGTLFPADDFDLVGSPWPARYPTPGVWQSW